MPDLQNVLKISDLFNVSTDYLLKDSIVEESACAAGVAESGYVNVFLHILLSCATAYIWHWVWVYRVSSAIRGYKGGSGLSPAVHLVLYILLPFYYIYWFYRHGHDIFIEEEKNGIGSKDVNTAMLICGVVSPVIGSVILQNRLNAVAVAKSERAAEGVSLEASIA